MTHQLSKKGVSARQMGSRGYVPVKNSIGTTKKHSRTWYCTVLYLLLCSESTQFTAYRYVLYCSEPLRQREHLQGITLETQY